MRAENHKHSFLWWKSRWNLHHRWLPGWVLIVSQSDLWSDYSSPLSNFVIPIPDYSLTVSLLRWCLIESNCSMKLILTNNTNECHKSSYILISPPHSGQAGGQNSWETKFHKRVRQSGQMIGLHGHDHESLFGTLGSLIGPLEAPQNDQKPLKMAISGTFKHPSQT